MDPARNNICRCCLVDGCYKDISTEYYCSGRKEIYEDLLRETFDIQIPYQEGAGPSSGSRLICEECITQLRGAYFFKQLILKSQQGFSELLRVQMLEKVDDLNDADNELKTETIKLEPLNEGEVDTNDDYQENCLTDSGNFEEDEMLIEIKQELPSVDVGTMRAGAKRKVAPGRRTRAKRSKINDCDNENCDKTRKDWLKIAERRGNGPLLREDSLKLISNSTICVFQWNKSRCRCFCCDEPFEDVDVLRDHTNTHTIEDIEKKIIAQQNRLVKVEISTIKCKLCHTPLENLTVLRHHLAGVHDIDFKLNEDLLLPFKIEENLQCQICREDFAVFRLLNIHMNRHYQKHVCHICGAGFSNLVFLNLHKTRRHRSYSCKQCGLVFPNKIDKKTHDVNVHNVKFERKSRFPCPYCQERFPQENFRVKHLVDKHGMVKPEHKCIVCSKVFITKSLCNNHMKNVHLKEKIHECDICHNRFYKKSDVARHRVTHTGEKKFPCTLCNNPYATKDSLRRHMKRTHVVR